ncbi:MAG: M16 family metallopeptidase [Polyangiales bacterium]
MRPPFFVCGVLCAVLALAPACKRHRGGRMGTNKPATAGSAANEEFRKTAPKAGPSKPWAPPKIVEAKLANGMRLLLVERHDLPIVAFQIVLDRGADQATPGAGSFLSSMLLQGTKTKSALEISDAFGRLGAQFGVSGGFDSLGLSVKVLSKDFPEALALAADCVRNPAFAKDEVERERAKRLTSITQQKDSPQTILRNTLAEVLYPESHPYHAPLLGNEAAVKKLTGDDLSKLHARLFQPSNVTIAIAGDITEEVALGELSKVLGDWKGTGETIAAVKEPADAAPGKRIILVDRPGATQSHMAATLVGVPRSSKDFHALMVLNTILGGQFSSRLNLNLREKHAYTYGAYSTFDMRHGAGPFSAGGAIVREKTEPAAEEILAEIKRIQDEPITDEELADAKTNLIRRLPAVFETAGDTAGSIAYLAIYGLPLDEYEHRAEGYRAVTKQDIQRVAKQYLKLDRIRLVIVGDANVVQKELAKLGLGDMEVRKP